MILSTTPEVSETMSVTSASSASKLNTNSRMPISSNILLASVIHPAASSKQQPDHQQHSNNFRENDFVTKIPPPLTLPPTPPIMNTNSMTTSLTASNLNSIPTSQQPRINVSSLLQRSATFSSMQTDI